MLDFYLIGGKNMPDARMISGYVALQCSANASHQWEVKYSVGVTASGDPDIRDLERVLVARRIKCPECGHISYKILKVTVKKVCT